MTKPLSQEQLNELMHLLPKITGREIDKIDYDHKEDVLTVSMIPQNLTQYIKWMGEEGVPIDKIKECMENMKSEIKEFLCNSSYERGLDPKKTGEQLGNVQYIINKHLGPRLHE